MLDISSFEELQANIDAENDYWEANPNNISVQKTIHNLSVRKNIKLVLFEWIFGLNFVYIW
jgi:hypothetical protein